MSLTPKICLDIIRRLVDSRQDGTEWKTINLYWQDPRLRSLISDVFPQISLPVDQKQKTPLTIPLCSVQAVEKSPLKSEWRTIIATYSPLPRKLVEFEKKVAWELGKMDYPDLDFNQMQPVTPLFAAEKASFLDDNLRDLVTIMLRDIGIYLRDENRRPGTYSLGVVNALHALYEKSFKYYAAMSRGVRDFPATTVTRAENVVLPQGTRQNAHDTDQHPERIPAAHLHKSLFQTAEQTKGNLISMTQFTNPRDQMAIKSEKMRCTTTAEKSTTEKSRPRNKSQGKPEDSKSSGRSSNELLKPIHGSAAIFHRRGRDHDGTYASPEPPRKRQKLHSKANAPTSEDEGKGMRPINSYFLPASRQS